MKREENMEQSKRTGYQLSALSQEVFVPRAPGLVAPEFGIQTKVKRPTQLPVQHCSPLSAPRKEPCIQQLTKVRSVHGQHMRRNQAKSPECSGLTAELERTAVSASLVHQVVLGLWDEKQYKENREGAGRENYSILLLLTLGLCFLPYMEAKERIDSPVAVTVLHYT